MKAPTNPPLDPQLPFKPNAVMFDFESGSLSQSSVPALLSVGMLAFNINNPDSPKLALQTRQLNYYSNIDLTQQFISGFHFDQNTAAWWRDRSAEAIAVLMEKKAEIDRVIEEMRSFIEHIKTIKEEDAPLLIFCRRTHADYSWLSGACELLDIKPLIKHNEVFDVATFIMAVTGQYKGYIKMPEDTLNQENRHHALNDCYLDAKQLIETHTSRRTLEVGFK